MRLGKKIIVFLLVMALPLGLLGCSFNVDELLQGKNPGSKDELTKDTEQDSNADITTDNNTEKDDVTKKDEVIENDKQDKEQQTTEKKNYRIFYYDIDYNIYYFDKEVEVVDKGVVKALTKEMQIAPNNNLKATLPNGIEVRTAKVENDILTVEFGSDFHEKLNLGSGSESAMLQCLVNTFGYNLGVKNVIIKVDGKNYSSGHIVLEEGKTFMVDYSKAKEGN